MKSPTLRIIARARLRLLEARSDHYPTLTLESCINLCLEYASDPWIATELAAYEETHPELVAVIRARRGKTQGGAA
jgi:hypothetical protein